jgi:hypothetical protein
MKKWSLILIVIILGVLVALFFHFTGLWKTISHEDFEGSVEITDVETRWVKKIYQPWPPKLTLVPAISFRVKNVSDKPLRYIYFNANFKFRDDFENLGDCFLAAIRGEPLLPGKTSDIILLQSNYGVEGKSLASFKDNPHWKVALVELFAKSQGSQYIPLGKWEVTKNIDFKEPEPVGMEKEEKDTDE